MNIQMKLDSKPRNQSGLADLNSPFLHNFWYVAGCAEDFTRELHEKTFLNQSVVIYRTEAGDLVALQNRCAHRSFPLSESWLEGDDIRCKYHDAKYNPDGELIDIPCQTKCPKVQAIRKYPIKEIGPLIWIWMGVSDVGDENEIPDTSWLNKSAGWEFATSSYHIEGNYMLMMENLMDLMHIPFLHQDTFNFPRSYAQMEFEIETKGDEITYLRFPTEQYHRNGLFPDYLADEFEDRNYQGKSGGRFIHPGMMYGIQELRLKDAKEDEREEYIARIPHFVTPETETTCHYWFFYTRNFAQDDSALTEKLKKTLEIGFAEDKEAIYWLQKMQICDKTPYQEINFAADKSTILMRKVIQKLVDEEYQTPD